MTDVVISFDWAPRIGGAHLWMYEVYKRWPAPVSVLTIRPADEPVLRRRQEEVDRLSHGSLSVHRQALPVVDIDAKSLSCWARFALNARVAGKIAGKGQRTFHCVRAFPEGFVGVLRKRLDGDRTRLITYAHGEEILVARSSRLLSWMARQAYACSDAVIANSENTRGLVMALCPQARVHVIHPGVDATAFEIPEQERLAFRKRLPWRVGTVVISTVARMERRKNQAAVIAAVAELSREGLQVGYICAGDGEERSALEALAHEYAIEDRVCFPGAVSDDEKRLVIAASDIFAMPSVRAGEMIEGFGIVFLEAAAAGVPAISGSSGGQSEAVVHDRTGLVVDGQDPRQVREALRRLALRAEERNEMGARARSWALEHDWCAVRDRTVAVTRSIGSSGN
ncbi:MAG: glycosyltransferase family 4 protein [Burkholderiaceae bacterium]|nr:glycosyltransferase family 4 protein [Burkholderiaceae bacterium]